MELRRRRRQRKNAAERMIKSRMQPIGTAVATATVTLDDLVAECEASDGDVEETEDGKVDSVDVPEDEVLDTGDSTSLIRP